MRPATGSIDHGRSGWRVRVTVGGERSTAGIFATEAEARGALAALLHMTHLDERDPLTLEDWADAWLIRREMSGNHRDIENERSRWETHGKPKLGKLALRAVTFGRLRKWVADLEGARQTKANALGVVRGMLRDAVAEGKIRSNPAEAIKIPKEARTEEPWCTLSLEEQKRLLVAVPEPERWIVAFAIGTGLRAGELCALRLEDVKSDRIVVRYGKPPSLPTKSGKIREVPLFGLASDAWKEWKKTIGKNPRGLAFPRGRGGFRDPIHVVRWAYWQEWQKDAGVSLRWHDLRHTCASSLVSGDWGRAWSLEEVRAMLGHSSIQVTERYAHFAGTALTRAGAEHQANWPQVATHEKGGDVDTRENESAPGKNRTCDLRFRKSLAGGTIPNGYVAKDQLETTCLKLVLAAAENRTADVSEALENFRAAVIDELAGPFGLARALELAGSILERRSGDSKAVAQ